VTISKICKTMAILYTCPICNNNNAYFDGVNFNCPDCDNKWKEPSISGKENNSSNIHIGNENFRSLIRLKEPFFRLKHGILYECKVENERGIEFTSIIPLAFEEGSNRQYVMINAIQLSEANPGCVQDIIKMDFRYIWNDGIKSQYPSDYSELTILCATKKDGTLIDYSGALFFDFKESGGI
jgi:hypothetical protein